jgi:hypothetical protein
MRVRFAVGQDNSAWERELSLESIQIKKGFEQIESIPERRRREQKQHN